MRVLVRSFVRSFVRAVRSFVRSWVGSAFVGRLVVRLVRIRAFVGVVGSFVRARARPPNRGDTDETATDSVRVVACPAAVGARIVPSFLPACLPAYLSV